MNTSLRRLLKGKIPLLAAGLTLLLPPACFLTPQVSAQVPLPADDEILFDRCRTAVLNNQMADGAIPLIGYKSTGQPAFVNPYFGCLTALGAISMHHYKPDARTLTYAEKWLNKMATLQKPDGTFPDYDGERDENGKLAPRTGASNHERTPDSHDSYAALHIAFAAAAQKIGVSLSPAVVESCQKSFNVLENLKDANGFYWNFLTPVPAGKVRTQYNLDNIEVHFGFASAHSLFTALGDNTRAGRAETHAEALANQMHLFWYPAQQYFVALYADKAAGIAWGGQPLSAEGLATVSSLAFFGNLAQQTRTTLWNRLLNDRGSEMNSDFTTPIYPDEDPTIERVYLAALKAGSAPQIDTKLAQLRTRADELLDRIELLPNPDFQTQSLRFPYVHRFGMIAQALLAQRGSFPDELPKVPLLITGVPDTLTIANAPNVNEGQSNTTNSAQFIVSLGQPSLQAVTVHYATANGTAQAGSDYNAISGDLSFAAGETSKTFSVPITGDYVVEPDETFTVNLSNAVNAVIADGQGIGTIINDDNDVTAPTVRFTTSATTPVGTTPVNDSTIYNAMPVITGTAADAGSGIAKVLLRLYRVKAGTTNTYEYWNGTSWISTVFYFTTTLNPATGGANVSWSKNSGAPTGTDFSDGTYHMVATAYDKANKTAAVSTSFTKLTDNELPTVRFTTSGTTPTGTTPVSGSTITGAIPTITGEAADAGSGISKVLLRLYRIKAGTTNTYEYWNGTSWISTVFYFTTTLNPATGGADVSWSKSSGWPTGTDFSDGTYYMVATAYDKANKTAAVSSSFKKATVAGLAPKATAFSTAQALADGQSIKLSFTGALSSTSASQTTNYSVSVNGTPVEVRKATYEGASSAVTLQLAAGTLSKGNTVSVSWNLRDSSGALVRGQTQRTVE